MAVAHEIGIVRRSERQLTAVTIHHKQLWSMRVNHVTTSCALLNRGALDIAAQMYRERDCVVSRRFTTGVEAVVWADGERTALENEASA